MILTFDSVNWFTKIIRPFFASIDWLIYSIIGWIMEGIFNLSNIMVDPAFVKNVYNRIYVIIAIFMVFKLAFSFLKYMVSPDSLTDKNDGVGKLIVRAITMLAILIMLPVLFFNQDLIGDGRGPVLSVLQSGLIKTVPKVILGIDDGSADDNGTYKNSVIDSAAEYGDTMAINMLSAFFFPEECRKNDSANTCTSNTKYIDSVDEFLDKINDHEFLGDYDYQYMWPLTTVAGVVLVITLIGMAIDIAIRTFKLIILQMIAPIPVMTYIDPKSSKDGAFSSWLKTFVSTYIDIFIKLATIYLLLLLISKVFAGDGNSIFKNTAQGFMSKNLVMVFLVIGLFKFAKDAPQFIKDALGIKSKGGSSFMGKAMSGIAGAAAGFAGGVATGGLAGGLSGIATGASAGFAGKAGQAFSQVRDEQAKLLGKTPGGVRGKLQNKAMQHSVMKHTGLDLNKLSDMKKNKIDADNALAVAEAEFNADPTNASKKDALLKAREKAGKATAAYENANSLAKQIGLKPGFMQENKRHGAAYVAASRVARNVGEIGTNIKDKINDLPTTQNIRDAADYVSNIPSNIRHSIDSSIYGGDDNADTLAEDRRSIREAKSTYKDTIRGGIDNKSDEKEIQKARDNLKTERRTLRDDKKDFRS